MLRLNHFNRRNSSYLMKTNQPFFIISHTVMLLTFSKTGPRFASFLFSVLRFPKLPESDLAPLRNRKLTSCSHRVLEA